MSSIKEYERVVNLYAIEQSKTYGNMPIPITLTLTDSYREYYVNKGTGDTVIKLGKS